jgi:DNA ligase (NAD+)
MNQKEKLYLEAKKLYYQGNPIMSDTEFDNLELELKKENSSVITIVGFSDRKAKFPHITPMLSLSKFQTNKTTGKPPVEEATTWMKEHIIGSQIHFSFTPKFDGNAANVIYKNGKLHIILSRGDGTYGRDITAKLMNQVPKTISNSNTIEVRGEVVIAKDIFSKKYSQFKNERNFVAGVLNKDEVDNNILSDLTFVAVEIKEIIGKTSDYISTSKLKDWGFNKLYELPEYYITAENFESAFKHMETYRNTKSPFLLDGFVIKVTEKYRNNFGENGHNPNWAIAIKFLPKEVITTVKSISWSFGKSGNFTPVANLEPVDLDGSTVSRASLYNYGFIVTNNVYPGAQVQIVKSGDIIPQVIKVIKESKDYFDVPTKCPFCDSKLHIENNLHLQCINEDCEGIKYSLFVQGVATIGIFGLGGSTMKSLWDAGFKTAIDILNPNKFNKKNLINSGVFADGKSIDNLLLETSKIKELKLSQLILMLGFNGVGHSTSEQIANKIAGIKFSFHGLQHSLVDGFDKNEPKRIKVESAIKELSQYIKIILPIEENISDKIKIEFTGSPKASGFATKEVFLQYIKSKNCVHYGLKKDTDYLITDSYTSSSSKMESAKKLNVKILTYEDFKKQLGQ